MSQFLLIFYNVVTRLFSLLYRIAVDHLPVLLHHYIDLFIFRIQIQIDIQIVQIQVLPPDLTGALYAFPQSGVLAILEQDGVTGLHSVGVVVEEYLFGLLHLDETRVVEVLVGKVTLEFVEFSLFFTVELHVFGFMYIH